MEMKLFICYGRDDIRPLCGKSHVLQGTMILAGLEGTIKYKVFTQIHYDIFIYCTVGYLLSDVLSKKFFPLVQMFQHTLLLGRHASLPSIRNVHLIHLHIKYTRNKPYVGLIQDSIKTFLNLIGWGWNAAIEQPPSPGRQNRPGWNQHSTRQYKLERI